MTDPELQPPNLTGTALVLSGGGVAGIAWELGVLRGIADVDPDLASRVLAADLIVGTSAGAAVAAQITSGVPLDDLYAAQLRPETAELDVEIDLDKLFSEYRDVFSTADGPEDAGQRLGALALAAQTVEPAARHAAIDARLPVKHWPDRSVLVTAVDAETGQLTVFTRDSGVALVDAVAASGAVPGVWPPVAIDGRRYVDGGVRTMTNADLAAGAERVLIIQTGLEGTPPLWGSLDAEIADLAPAAVHTISADQAAIDAFGPNALSPATRAESARAGRALGAAHAERVATLWE